MNVCETGGDARREEESSTRYGNEQRRRAPVSPIQKGKLLLTRY
jgi:hypothetical protein